MPAMFSVLLVTRAKAAAGTVIATVGLGVLVGTRTVSVATALVAAPRRFVITTRYCPASADSARNTPSTASVSPGNSVPSTNH